MRASAKAPTVAAPSALVSRPRFGAAATVFRPGRLRLPPRRNSLPSTTPEACSTKSRLRPEAAVEASQPVIPLLEASWRHPNEIAGTGPGDDNVTSRNPGSHGAGDPLLELLLGGGADLARRHLAVLEQHQGRDRHDAVFGRGLRVLVHIELDDLDLAVERTVGDLLERRRDPPARAAPFGPK